MAKNTAKNEPIVNEETGETASDILAREESMPSDYRFNPETGYFEVAETLQRKAELDTQVADDKAKLNRRKVFWNNNNRVYLQAGMFNDKPQFIEVTRLFHGSKPYKAIHKALVDMKEIAEDEPGQVFQFAMIVWSLVTVTRENPDGTQETSHKWRYVRINTPNYLIFKSDNWDWDDGAAFTATGKHYTENPRYGSWDIAKKSLDYVNAAYRIVKQAGKMNGKRFTLNRGDANDKLRTPFKEVVDKNGKIRMSQINPNLETDTNQ